jgi:RimJ/RimL family protein N-acetyltransferase
MHRALEKSGYRKIARRRRMYLTEGAWRDDYVFELLREEWEAEQR